MRIVVDSAGLVLMWSDRSTPAPPPGGQLVELSEGLEAEFRSMRNEAGLIFDGQSFRAVEPPPPAVPREITPLQGRRVLRGLGIIDQVAAWVATQGPHAIDAWEYSTTWVYGDVLITAAAAEFGLDQDEFFRTAATL